MVSFGVDAFWRHSLESSEGVRVFRYDDPALTTDLVARTPDLAWIQHQLIPEALLRNPGQTTFLFHHMSAMHPGEFPIAYRIETALASAVVFAAPETRDAQTASHLLDEVDTSRLAVFGNPAPDAFAFERASYSASLRRLLVVSNHLPPELSEAMHRLRDRVEVRVRGNESGNGGGSSRIGPADIEWADGVVSIGKTVQYALVSGTPIYCYDYFGGPGWLSAPNLDAARYANFSGRGFDGKTAPQIADELVSGFLDAQSFAIEFRATAVDQYVLSSAMKRLLASLRPLRASNLPEADIASHQRLQDQRRIFINVAAAREGEAAALAATNRELHHEIQRLTAKSDELDQVRSSRSYSLVQTLARARRLGRRSPPIG